MQPTVRRRPSTATLEGRTAGAFGLALLLLLTIAFASFRNVERLTEDASWVAHTEDVRNHLTDLLSAPTILDRANVSIIATDPEGLIVTFNAGAERIPGCRAEIDPETFAATVESFLHRPDEGSIP